jgi:hypothetical protein
LTEIFKQKLKEKKMRKIIFTLALAVGMVSAISAQVNGKALGLRPGNGFGNSAEISYQHPLGTANRLEADLGASNNGLHATGIYQWVWDLSTVADGLNWYAGFGGNVSIWHNNSNYSSDLSLGVAGQLGIEYNFDIPLQLSLDYRPIANIIPLFGDNSYNSVSLALRYRF